MTLCRDEFGDPVFGKIINFVSPSGDGEWLVAVEHVQTTAFFLQIFMHLILFL